MAHDLEKKWRSRDVQLHENVDFSALLLSDRVLYGLKKTGFKKPSPIQLESIPFSKIGKDLLVQAKSGTGKTLVFVITALEMLRRKLFRPQVLIIVPTREIAAQVCSVVKSVGAGFSKLTCFNFIGGMSVSDDIQNARTCQIAVGTPGRINQLIREKLLPTNSIRLLVFDEADQLLQMSFKEDINQIFGMLPNDKQVITTSATYPVKLKKILFKYLREPHVACLDTRDIALLGIVHYAKLVKVSPMPLIQYKLKLSVLEQILKTVKFSQCLVFCNGIQRVEVLYKDIKKWGFSSTYISSAKQQCDRLKAIHRLKHFKCKVLVSSDVTARGIDAENVDLVINFDLAFGIDTYMHRAGRAGRYGSIGVSISIIEENKIVYVKKMEAEVDFKTYKLPDPIPEDLIQNACFGEYFIEEIEEEDSEKEEPVTLSEDTTNILVDTENNVIENTKAENEEILHKRDSTFDVNDCVLEKLVATNKISDVVPEIASHSCFEKVKELHLTSSESIVEPLENVELSKNENHVKLVKVDEGIQEDFSNTLTSDFFVRNDLNDDDLNRVIKTFLDGYKTNGIQPFVLNDKGESDALQSSEKKAISIGKIIDLGLKKTSYFYEVCKKYEIEKEKQSQVSSEEKINEYLRKSFQNEVCEQDNYSPKDTIGDISLQTGMDCLSDSADEQSFDNPVGKSKPIIFQDSSSHLKSVLQHEQSEPDHTSDCEFSTALECRHISLENQKMLNNEVEEPKHETFQEPSIQPKFGSPPINAKSQDNRIHKSASDEQPNDKLVSNFKPCVFGELSESDSNNTEFSENFDLDVSQKCSSESSDEESSCDFSDSSSSEDYKHNKFRTGKQNPSLVSSSASNYSEKRGYSKCKQKETFSKYFHSGCLKYNQPIHCLCSKNYPQYPYSYPQTDTCNFPRGAFRDHSYPSCCRQHVARGRSCLQPSGQRCNNSMQAQWHATFYSQWRHLQNCINSVPY